MKNCKVCNIEKSINCFRYHSTTGYYSRTCKDCENISRNEKRKKIILESGGKFDTTKSKIKTKICSVCNENKPINPENFRYTGRCWEKCCKECQLTQSSSTERYRNLEDLGKECYCSKCKSYKECTENFYYKKHKSEYHSYCISCWNSYMKEKEREWGNGKYKKRKSEKINKLFFSYRNFDFSRNLTFDLDRDFIKENIEKPCSYCGFQSTGFDRIDNSKGHMKENCIPCCSECNTARMDNFTYNEMLLIGNVIKQIKEKRQLLINNN